MNYLSLVNLLFSCAIVVFGIRQYQRTKIRAFLFFGLAYISFGFTHLSLVMGWPIMEYVLVAARAIGYTLMITGLLL